jgi:hypothetical protein
MDALRIEFQPKEGQADILYRGKNGWSSCRGLEIWDFQHDASQVTITPMNSRGITASCEINLPKDPTILTQIGNHFLALASESLSDASPKYNPVELGVIRGYRSYTKDYECSDDEALKRCIELLNQQNA